jgi:AraC family transcriptional regulator of adaptative response/methylated-DNA-[protein]-cysteine methyltransferase
VARACAVLDRPGPPATLAGLASELGVSPFHLHRVFRAETGITPKAYAGARRADRARDALATSPSVIDAAYDAGYGSTGRFYDDYPWRLGMPPSDFRHGGRSTTVRFAVGRTTLGSILVAATERGVCAISLGDDPEVLVRDLQDCFDAAELVGDDPAFARVVATVIGLVEDPRRRSTLPLDIRGTAFQERVWQALRQIGPGTTVTYAEIAARIGSPGAVRAVGAACGANPVAVVVPCHRVVRTDGGLSGYRWGIERKSALLQREMTTRRRP